MWVPEILEWVPLWTWYLLVTSALIYLYGVWPYLTTSINLPGPKPLPFVGNMISMIRQGRVQTALVDSRKHGRTYLSWLGQKPEINVTDPDFVKEICVKDFANFTNRSTPFPMSKNQKAMLINLEGDHWKFVRGVLSPAFSSGKMRKMVPLIQVCLDRMLQNLETHSENKTAFDVKAVMGALTMEVIGAVAFGIDTGVQKNLNDTYLKMAKEFFSGNILTRLPVALSTFFPSLLPFFETINVTSERKHVTEFLKNMLLKTIKERRLHMSNRQDLLQLILDSSLDDLKDTLPDKDVDTEALKLNGLKRDKTLSDNEVEAQALLVLLAGYETTASVLSYFAYNMALYPDCQDKLIQEIDMTLKGDKPTYENVMLLPYLEMCFAETQRLYPAAYSIARVAKQSRVIKGVFIPTGCCVRMMNYVMHHDEKYWPEPEKFDPQRFSPEEKAKRNPYVYFPFGIGPRNCVGMRLAQLEAKMALVAILQKFLFIRAPETEVPIQLGKGILIQAQNGIWLKVQARK